MKILIVYCTEMTNFSGFTTKQDELSETFRPGNLEPKKFITAFITRQLVAEAERNYLARIANEEKNKLKQQQKQLQREIQIQKTIKLFENRIIPHWQEFRQTKEVSNLIKKGLPSKVRGQIWVLLVNNPHALTEEIFHQNLEKARSVQNSIMSKEELTLRDSSLRLISLDITRTFNNLGYFREDSPMNNDLRELLEAASVYRSDIGYIQGMSYVAGMLLLNLEIIPAFQLFIYIITTPLMLPFYKIEQEGIKYREEIFIGILRENVKDLSEHFENEGVQLAIFLMEWFVTLYSKTLSQEVAVRIWDLYFYFGDTILFKTGLSIMKILYDQLIHCDLTGIMECMSHISESITDPDILISNIDHIKLSEYYLGLINNL